MLHRKLTIEEQKEILSEIFGFTMVNEDAETGGEHWVIYDDEGMEFYGKNTNDVFDLTTLKGIFIFMKLDSYGRGHCAGKADVQHTIKAALGLND